MIWKYGVFGMLGVVLLLAGCDEDTSYHRSEYEYNQRWGSQIINSSVFPHKDVEQIEVYSDNSGKGFPQPYKALSIMPVLWKTSDPTEIDLFIKELRNKQPRPLNIAVYGQDVTLHIVFKRKGGMMGYGRCLWHSDALPPYGYIKSWGDAKAYKYTQTLLPWLREKGVTLK